MYLDAEETKFNANYYFMLDKSKYSVSLPIK